MGICHACTCRKTAGRVRDLRTGQLSEAGEEEIQICVSVPVGSVTLDI
jgi:stearoyl-CoA 9-desaturase NADPH oxidoreductase